MASKRMAGYVYEIIGINNCTLNNFQINIANKIDSNITIANMTLTYDDRFDDASKMLAISSEKF